MMGLSSTPEKFLNHQINLYFKAIQQNKIEDVKSILRVIEDASIPNLVGKVVVNHLIQKKSGDTGIHICATLGFLEILRYLVEEKGSNLEQINLDGKTALHDAAQFSQLEIIKYLLDKGANKDVVKRADWTPLMLASTKLNIEVIKTLLESGADPFFVNKDGWNCCHISSREGNPEIVKLILNSCKPEARKNLCQTRSRNGRKPLHTAVMHGNFEVTKLLIEESSIEEANEADHCGTTSLMEACRFGYLNLIDYLIKYTQADLKTCNKQGLNCFHISAEAGQSSSIQLLKKKYGMDLESQSESLGMTAMHWAAKEGQEKATKVLLSLGANPNTVDFKGRTPANIALIFGHPNIADLLNALVAQ